MEKLLAKIYEAHIKNGLAIIGGAPGAYFRPKSFFKAVMRKSPRDQLVQALVLAAFCTVIQFCVFSVSFPQDLSFSYFRATGVTLLDIAFITGTWVPVLWVSSRLLGLRPRISYLISYSIIAKSLYVMPAILAYGIFVLTEDYTFATLRLIFIGVHLVFFVAIFCISISSKLKQRAFLAFAMIAAIFLYGSVLARLSAESFSGSKNIATMFLIYDPIADEVLGVLKEINKEDATWRSTFLKVRSLILDSTNQAAAQKKLTAYFSDNTAKKEVEALGNEKKLLEESLRKAKFSTTKNFIKMKLAAHEEKLKVFDYSGESIDEQLKKHEVFIEADNSYMKSLNEYLDAIIKYRQNHVIVF